MNNETYFEFDNELYEGYTTVPNYILNDTRLTYKAVGVYVQILQYRNTGKHKVYIKSLANYRTDKKSAVSSAINELIETGYVTKHQLRNEKGHIKGVKYIIRSKPLINVEISTSQPKADFLTSENPTSDNQPLKIKYNKNKINKKQNYIATQSEDKPLVVDKNENVDLIESNTHLLLDSKNKKDKVSKWNKDRLLKAIDIFKDRQGEYFSLLEKIYKDDKNFAPKTNSKGSSAPKVKTKFHNINETYSNYSPDELKEVIKESQKNKFKTPQDTKSDKSIDNKNKTSENANKYVIDAWAINVIENKSNMSVKDLSIEEILEIADKVGVKLELDESAGAYMLAFR